MIKKFGVLIFLTSLLLNSSCKDENANPVGMSKTFFTSFSQSELTLEDILSNYDTTNVIGLIKLNELNTQMYHFNDTLISDTLIEIFYKGEANFFNDDSLQISIDCGGLNINQYSFYKIDSLNHVYYGSGYNNKNGDLSLNFNSQNSIEILGSSDIPQLDTLLNFNNSLTLLNVFNGDTLNLNSDLTLNWNGINNLNNNFCELTLSKVPIYQNELDTSKVGNLLFENTGSVTIASNAFNDFGIGWYCLEFSRFSIFRLNFANNKHAFIILKSGIKNTVYLNRN